MAEVDKKSVAREQYRALLQMRWILFRRSLQSKDNRVLLVLRIIQWVVLSVFLVGMTAGFGFAAFLCVGEGKRTLIASSFSFMMLIWQGYVLLRSTSSHNVSGELLRFPMSFRTYATLWTLSGVFDIPTIIGASVLFAVFIGSVLAEAPYFPTLFGVCAFFIFNIALSRTVLLWMEKLLARRRVREFVIALFSLIGFLPQLMRVYGKNVFHHLPAPARHVLDWLPGSLLANTIMRESTAMQRALSVLALLLLASVFTALVLFRLRTLYRGENLHEATGGPLTEQEKQKMRQRRLQQSGSSKVPAIIWENEFRKLWHNGAATFQLFSPLLLIIFFGIRWAHSGPYLLPGAILYLSFDLGGRSFNSLGTDGAGAQLYRLAPVSMRDVFFGKNLATLTVYAAQFAVLVLIVVFFSHIVPALAIFSACFAVFALSVYFTVGNKMSLRRPLRIDAGKLDVQSLRAQRRARGANSWRTLLTFFGVPAFGAALLIATVWLNIDWIIASTMLVSACIAAVVYKKALNSLHSIGAAEMENALGILSKTN